MFTTVKQFLSCITFKPSPKAMFILHIEYIFVLAAFCSDFMHRNLQFFYLYLWQTRVLNQVPSVHSWESYLYAIWTEGHSWSLDIYFRLIHYCTDWKNRPPWRGLEPRTPPLGVWRPIHIARETEAECISFDIYLYFCTCLVLGRRNLAPLQVRIPLSPLL